jgi:hypothetical protein
VTATIIDFCNLLAYQAAPPAVPYLFGGIWLKGDPTHAPGFDCSGGPYAAALKLGQSIARTSEGQFSSLPAAPVNLLRRGDAIFYDVASDTQPQPAHEAIWWDPFTVWQAPRTGEDCGFYPKSALPFPIMGYRRLPFPGPPPPPPINQEDILDAYENSAGETVIVGNSNGHTVVVTSGVDKAVVGGWSVADVTDAIAQAYPGQNVVVE